MTVVFRGKRIECKDERELFSVGWRCYLRNHKLAVISSFPWALTAAVDDLISALCQ